MHFRNLWLLTIILMAHGAGVQAKDLSDTLLAFGVCTEFLGAPRDVIPACSEVIRYIEREAPSDSERVRRFNELSRQYLDEVKIRFPEHYKFVVEMEQPRDLAVIYSLRGNNLSDVALCEPALADFDTVLRLTAHDRWREGNALAWKGRALNCLKRHQEALANLNKAIERGASAAKYAERARAHSGLDNHRRAIEDLDRSISMDAKSHTAFGARAFAYAMLGDGQRAIADATKVIELMKSSDAYETRGDYYMDVEEYDLAIADFTEAISLDPKNWLAYVGRAGAYEEKGDEARAAADNRMADELLTSLGASPKKK